MTFERFPFIVGWELTLACNLRCNHCASSAGIPRPFELTTKEALKICDQFPDLLVQQVCFTGGEPLLRPDWVDIAMYLRDMGIVTGMVTNGLLLNSDIIHNIKESEMRSISLSIDGLEDTHDIIRGRKGAFIQTIKGIKMLQESNLSPAIITTVNNRNIHELPQIYDFLKDIGVHLWRIQPMIPEGRGMKSGGLEMNACCFEQLIQFVKCRELESSENDVHLYYGDGLEIVNEGCREKPWGGCVAGFSACGIKSDGKVIGCLAMTDDLVEGDLRKKDLWDIWFNPDSFAYNRHFSPNDLGQGCKSCDKAVECHGGCSVCSYSATGHFHDNPYCYYRNSTRGIPIS
jgi:radical SAM protein with 4Fe4S-binding SPASM domain